MKKILTIMVFAFSILFLACSNDEPKDDDGVLKIKNVNDLLGLAESVNSGKNDFYRKKIILVNDLDLSSIENWTPIGKESARFRGYFDGQNHKISGLKINSPYNDNQGLFGYADSAKISNLNITDAVVIGYEFVGTLLGRAWSATTIQNCSAENVSVEGYSVIGGLIGGINTESKVEKCFVNDVIVKGKGVRIGGLTGTLANNATLSNSYAVNCEVSGGGDNCGVLVGSIDACEINNCYAVGKVSTNSNQVGGLGYVSRSEAKVNNSFYSAEVNGVESGLELSAMKDKSTFTGWDFNNIWTISTDKNNGFPTLK